MFHELYCMKKWFILFIFSCFIQSLSAQKIESIHFHLYTDSLIKGFYNYINIDGKTSDGVWMALDSSHIEFTANTGHFKGNDLFIDSTYFLDSIVVKAVLKSNPKLWKQTTIYIQKRGFDEALKTNEELLEEIQNKQRKKKRNNLATSSLHLPKT
jgi:hypothetical protein